MARASSPASDFDLDQYLADRRNLVEAQLARALDHKIPPPLGDAMRYAVLGEGKRLRPILTLAAAEAVSGSIESRIAATDLGCAVEMIHAYSLVHDDLPAMDDDDLRRGQPTVHKKFDEATAILAGDALQALAFQIAATADALSSMRRARAVAILARAAGGEGMVGGQVIDLAAEGRWKPKVKPAGTVAALEQLAGSKTGALIAAAVELGALAGGAGPVVRRKLGEYGRAVGLAFQIADDLLDAEGSTAEVGKKTGKDVAKGKVTFPGLMGPRAARERAEHLVDTATRIAKRFPNEGGAALAGIANWAIHRRK